MINEKETIKTAIKLWYEELDIEIAENKVCVEVREITRDDIENLLKRLKL